MKRKRLYVQPTTRVVMLQARNRLLSGSVATSGFKEKPEEVDMD